MIHRLMTIPAIDTAWTQRKLMDGLSIFIGMRTNNMVMRLSIFTQKTWKNHMLVLISNIILLTKV